MLNLTNMSVEKEKLIIGQINGVFGVAGWLKIFSHTDPRDNILQYSPWLIKVKGEWESVKIAAGKSQQSGKTVVAKLDGVNNRDIAKQYMGCDIAIYKDQLVATSTDFYWVQLIGCQVTNVQNELLGTVSSLVETGAHDVLRVEQDGKSILIPYVLGKFVLDVDVEHKAIKVDWERWED